MKKLPKSLTTITTFSKTLALLLLIIFIFGGFYLGTQYQAKLDGANLRTYQTVQSK